MSQNVSDLLRRHSRAQQTDGFGVTKYVGSPLTRRVNAGLPEAMLDERVDGAKVLIRGTSADEDLTRGCLWTASLQVRQDCLPCRPKQGQIGFGACLRVADTQSLSTPIHIVQPQVNYFSGP